jgi:hypothetical protein
LLQRSAFGLLDYPSIHLGKSTVFAAYAAHGCVVLNTASPGPQADGLAGGTHFLHLSFADAGASFDVADRQAMSAAARAWYAQHPLPRQAEAIATLCAASSIKEPVHA